MTGNARGRPGEWFSRALDMLTLAALGLAIWLLAGTWTERKRAVAADQPITSAVGTTISNLETIGPAGRSDELGPASDSVFSLIYIFKSDCPACAAQKARWIEFASLARESGWSVTALTPEPLDPAVSAYFDDPGIEVLQLADPVHGFEQLRTAVVPTTIVVGRDRRVLSHWTGRLAPAAEDSLRGLLAGTRLGSRVEGE